MAAAVHAPGRTPAATWRRSTRRSGRSRRKLAWPSISRASVPVPGRPEELCLVAERNAQVVGFVLAVVIPPAQDASVVSRY